MTTTPTIHQPPAELVEAGATLYAETLDALEHVERLCATWDRLARAVTRSADDGDSDGSWSDATHLNASMDALGMVTLIILHATGSVPLDDAEVVPAADLRAQMHPAVEA